MADTAPWEEEERGEWLKGLSGWEGAHSQLQSGQAAGTAHLILGGWGSLFLFLSLKNKIVSPPKSTSHTRSAFTGLENNDQKS